MHPSETIHWTQTGCEVASDCLECPLPVCKWDDIFWYRRHRRLAGDFRVARAVSEQELSAGEAGEQFGITERTVFRILARVRRAELDLPQPLRLAG